MGNKADVSGNDLLEHWEDDPETRVICMYLESFGNPRRFTEIAKRVGAQEADPGRQVGPHRRGRARRLAATPARSPAPTSPSRRFLDAVRRAARQHHRGAVRRRARPRALPAAGGDRVGDRHQRRRSGDHGDRRLRQPRAAHGRALATRRARELRSFLPAEASVANPVDMIASATPRATPGARRRARRSRRSTWRW